MKVIAFCISSKSLANKAELIKSIGKVCSQHLDLQRVLLFSFDSHSKNENGEYFFNEEKEAAFQRLEDELETHFAKGKVKVIYEIASFLLDGSQCAALLKHDITLAYTLIQSLSEEVNEFNFIVESSRSKTALENVFSFKSGRCFTHSG